MTDNETESRAEFTDEEAISGLLEQAQAANEIIEELEAENARLRFEVEALKQSERSARVQNESLRVELERVNRMLAAATAIVFGPDEIHRGSDDPDYWLAQGEPFVEYDSPLLAFEAAMQEGE